jgi:hypothetical protein
MPLSYGIDRESGILRITAIGTPSVQEQLDLAERWSNDPAYEVGMPILMDNRQRTQPSTREHVVEVANLAEKSPFLTPGTRCAVVVASDAEFGMTRMFSMLSENSPLETRVFRNLRSAEEWLLPKGGT